jgi:hypothetical protein
MIINVEETWKDSPEHMCCLLYGLKCSITKELSPDAIGIGSVEYCRKLHNWAACDPYPDWLCWGRGIYKKDVSHFKVPLFYKPSDIPKRFKSSILSSPPKTPYYASDVIHFKNEFRAYIVNGKVLKICCYSNFDTTDKINFPWIIPSDITAAVDFGMTNFGILPIEVNDPYSVGWYGSLSDYKIYAEFVIAGWNKMILK